MKDTMYTIKQIIATIVFIAVLSTMGMITGRPIMMLAYAGFFIILSLIIYLTLKRKQHHFEVEEKSNKTTRIIFAVILMVLAIIAPMLIALRTDIINLPESATLGLVIPLMLGLSIIFIALILFAVHMINVRGGILQNRIIGYLSFIIAAVIPGVLMSRVDMSTMGMGSVYYVALAVLFLAYNSRSLYCSRG